MSEALLLTSAVNDYTKTNHEQLLVMPPTVSKQSTVYCARISLLENYLIFKLHICGQAMPEAILIRPK